MNAAQRRHARRRREALSRKPERVMVTTLMRPGNKPKGANRNKGTSMSGLQRGGDGRTSLWAASPYMTDPTMGDRRWDSTVTSHG